MTENLLGDLISRSALLNTMVTDEALFGDCNMEFIIANIEKAPSILALGSSQDGTGYARDEILGMKKIVSILYNGGIISNLQYQHCLAIIESIEVPRSKTNTLVESLVADKVADKVINNMR